MRDPKKIKPGVWIKAIVENPVVLEGDLCIVLLVEETEGSMQVTYWNKSAGFESALTLDEVTKYFKLARKDRWHVTKPAQLNENDWKVFCACSQNGRQLFITAGCRWFDRLEDATNHWMRQKRGGMTHAKNQMLNSHRLAVIRKFSRALQKRRAAHGAR